MKHVDMAYLIHMYGVRKNGAGPIMIENSVYADYSNNKRSCVEQRIGTF